MFPDFKELLSALNAHRVRYLIVGGYAVSLHAEPRATKDLDILIGADRKNARAVYAALAEFGAPLEGLRAADFTEPDNFFRMGTPPVMVDIMPRISGVDFDKAWERRVNVAIDETLTVPFISRDDLLEAKLSAARPQDLADVAALGGYEERRDREQQQAAQADQGGLDEITERQRMAAKEWMKLRQDEIAAGASRTPEEERRKGVSDWLKLRQEEAEASRDSQGVADDEDLKRKTKADEASQDRSFGDDED